MTKYKSDMKNLTILTIVFVALTAGVSAQTKVNVRFVRGATSATLHGSINGYRYVDYRVDARAGQTISVRLTSSSQYAGFVIFDKNMENLTGSNGEADWSGELPSDGRYVIRVLLPRAAARRKASASYSIFIGIT